MKHLWKDRNLPGRIAGVTPSLGAEDLIDVDLSDYDNIPFGWKGREIKNWLSEHAQKDTRYVIIDDVPDILPEQQEHYIETVPRFGLTMENAVHAIQILS